MESKKTFGSFIQQKRKDLGLTQKELADKLFITEYAVSKWERGLSYPDITLIKDLCEALSVSERELLTASEDVEARTNEKLAKKYIRLINRFKWVQFIFYGLVIVTCFICNLAVQHTLSWFFIVLTALMMVASFTLVPVLVSKRKALVVLCSFTVSLLLLLFVCSIISGGSWFVIAAIAIIFSFCIVFLPFALRTVNLSSALQDHKALLSLAIDTALLFALIFVVNLHVSGEVAIVTSLLVAVFWLILPWGILAIIRYTQINAFFKTASCLGIFGFMFYYGEAITSYIITGKPINIMYTFDFSNWNNVSFEGNLNVLILGVFLALIVVFTVAGIAAELRKGKVSCRDKADQNH